MQSKLEFQTSWGLFLFVAHTAHPCGVGGYTLEKTVSDVSPRSMGL